MKKNDFEPAKIISRPDSKQDEPANQEGSPNSTELEPVPRAQAEQPTQKSESTEESFSDIIVRFAEENKAAAEQGENIAGTGDPHPAVSKQKPTVSQMVERVQTILVTFVVKGLEAIGDYLLQNVFDGNFKKALSKDPYKGTSLNDLAKHKDMPLSRQRLAECIRAAAVTQELNTLGLELDYYQRVEISKVRNQDARVKLAKEAHSKALTVQEVRDRARKLTGKTTSADKRMAHAVIKQLSVLAHLSVDEDTREFLMDKDRLRAALSTGETAKLLDNSEKFREAIGDSEELLHTLEKTLVEIVVERRQEDQPAHEKAHTTTDI